MRYMIYFFVEFTLGLRNIYVTTYSKLKVPFDFSLGQPVEENFGDIYYVIETVIVNNTLVNTPKRMQEHK